MFVCLFFILYVACVVQESFHISFAEIDSFVFRLDTTGSVEKSIFAIDNEMHRTQKACPRSSKCHSYEITSPLPTVDVWIIHFSLTLLTLTEIHTPHKRDNFDFRNLLSRINAMSRVRYHSVGIE